MASILEGTTANLSVLLTEAEAAERIGWTLATLRHYRWTGKGPAYIKASQRRVQYRAADVEAWLDRHRIDPEAAV